MSTSDDEVMSLMVRHMQNMEVMFKQQQDTIDLLLTGNASQSSGPLQRSSQPKAISGVKAPRLSADSNLSSFNSWRSDWEDFYQTQQLSNHPPESQVAALKSCLDEEIKRFMRQDVIMVPSGGTVDHILDAIKSWIKKKRNCLLDRREFYNRQQEKSEPFDNFFADIKELHDASDFQSCDTCSTCTNNGAEALRDRILTGIYCDETREKLLAEKTLSLDKAVEMCRAIESAADTNKGMASGSSSSAYAFRQQSTYKKMQKEQKESDASAAQPCTKCGYLEHTTKDGKCPAIGQKCKICDKKGHRAIVCKSKDKKEDSDSD